MIHLITGLALICPILNTPLYIDTSYSKNEDGFIYFEFETNHIGAGILPYYIDPTDNEAYFLLGKESKGAFKNTWCDFGGSKDDDELSFETAAREGFEESKGLLGNIEFLKSKISIHRPLSNKNSKYLYHMFLLKINFPEKLTQKEFEKINTNKISEMEKSSIRMVKVSAIFDAVINAQNIPETHYKVSKIILEDGEELILRGSFAKLLLNVLKSNEDCEFLESLSIPINK